MNTVYKRNIYLLLPIKFITSLFLIKVIYTIYFQIKGLSLYQLGIILAVYQLFKVTFEIPTGVIADKFGRKISVIIGLILFDLYLILIYLGNNMFIFGLATAIQGIAFTFISGSFSALLVDSVFESNQKDKLARIGSINQLVFYSGFALGALLGGKLADMFNYDTVYIIQIIIFAIPILIMTFVKEPPIHKEASLKKVSWKSVLEFIKTKPKLIYFMLTHMCIAIAFIAIDDYYPNYLISLGVNETITGLILFFLQIIGSIIVFFIVEKIKKQYKIKTIILAPIIMMISLACAFILKHSILSYIFYFIGQISFILISPLIFEISHNISPSCYRATIDSYFSLSIGFAAIICHLIFGYLSNIYGLSNTFLILILISFIFLNINNFIFKKKV